VAEQAEKERSRLVTREFHAHKCSQSAHKVLTKIVGSNCQISPKHPGLSGELGPFLLLQSLDTFFACMYAYASQLGWCSRRERSCLFELGQNEIKATPTRYVTPIV
jgi:hypothetical protein